jgi:hypothetical protein
LLAIGGLLLAVSAGGQANRTFVAANKGSDTGVCPPTAPCQTLAYALTQTNAGGEVILLESGEYGTATITQSVSVSVTPGIYAGITVGSGAGISVNAGVSDVVTLRGLSFISFGGFSGVGVFQALGVHIENCVFQGAFSGYDVDVEAATSVFIDGSSFKDFGVGILVSAPAPTATAVITRTRLENGLGTGIYAWNNSKVSASQVVCSGVFICFDSNPSSGAAELNLDDCVATNSTFGVVTEGLGPGGIARVSDCTVTDNSNKGLVRFLGALYTLQNNTVEGNASADLSGTITPLSGK